MIEGIVYFASPRTRWAEKVDSSDIIARYPARWRWLARAQARATHKRLDPERCGYAVIIDGATVEHVDTTK